MLKTLVGLILFFLATGQAGAVNVSTFSSSGCAFPDTNQSISYTATFGEDHDYSSSASTMSFTIYNLVGISSVTVDNRTGLMWITNPKTDAGMGGTYSWENAISACESLNYAGFADWRLPNIRELFSISDLGKAAAPFVNALAFPNTVSSPYWSSTTARYMANYAFYVTPNTGTTDATTKVTIYYVRCVRGGPK